MATLDESTFDRLAAETLDKLELALSEADDQLEIDLAMGVLRIEFEDGTTFVVNSHRAARQIWMAAGATAWHFDPTPEGEWIASKPPHEELWATVESRTSAQLGRNLSLRTH